MPNFKSYEKIGGVSALSRHGDEAVPVQWRGQWKKKAMVVFLVICSVLLVVSAVCLGIGFLRRPTKSQVQQVAGESGFGGTRSADLIESVCNKTLYFEVCNSSLSVYPGVLQANMSELVRITVELSLDDAKRIANFTRRLNGTGAGGALEDCVELFDDTMDEFNASLSLLAHAHSRRRADDLNTWLSAALTYPSTCIQGLEDVEADGDVVRSIKGKVDHLTQLTSNALAILNYVSATENIHNISQKNRRLLTYVSVFYVT